MVDLAFGAWYFVFFIWILGFEIWNFLLELGSRCCGGIFIWCLGFLYFLFGCWDLRFGTFYLELGIWNFVFFIWILVLGS